MKKQQAVLHPKYAGMTNKPKNMARINLSTAERELFERLGLEIYSDCCNAGLSLRNTVTALILSGMDWGIKAQKR